VADNNVQDAIEKVDEILSPKKFNLADAIKGKSYPTDSVRVYLDEEAIYELRELEKQLDGLGKHKNPEEVQELFDATRAQADEAVERLLATSYKITMQSKGHTVYDEIVDEVNAEFAEDTGPEVEKRRAHEENIRVIAKSIISVENNEGAIDGDRDFTPEEVQAFYVALPDPEWIRLQELFYKLVFAGTYFDKAVDAGFLSRR
jgi:hypothetical protein